MRFFAILSLLLSGLFMAQPVSAEENMVQYGSNQGGIHQLGSDKAPVTIDEYISLTCPHCADFYLHTLPELKKRYVDTGKVKIITHNYPLDGISLKAAGLATEVVKPQLLE